MRRVLGAADGWTKALFLAFASSLVMAGFAWSEWRSHRQSTEDDARRSIQLKVTQAAHALDQQLHQVLDLTTELADKLSTGRIDPTGVAGELERVLHLNPDLHGIGVTFAPNAYRDDIRLFSPCLYRDADGRPRSYQYSDYCDYTVQKDDPAPQYRWYGAAQEQGPGWYGNYRNAVDQVEVAVCAAPFTARGGSAFQGVVLIQLPLRGIPGLLSDHSLISQGSPFLIDDRGDFIPYATSAIGVRTEGIQALGLHIEEDVITRLREALEHRETDLLELSGNLEQGSLWIAYQSVPTIGWTLGLALNPRELLLTSHLYRLSIAAALWTLVCGLSSCFLVISVLRQVLRSRLPDGHDEHRTIPLLRMCQWIGTACAGFLMIGTIGYIWRLEILMPISRTRDHHGMTVNDQQSLRETQRGFVRESIRRVGQIPRSVPTGLLIQSIESLGPLTLRLSGYVWQKIHKDRLSHQETGLVFPTASSVRMADEPSYRTVQGDLETLGWAFELTLKQDSDFSRYPFDRMDVVIRIAPRDFSANLALSPDLQAYPNTSPTSLPGLDPGVSLAEWTIERSTFEFQRQAEGADLGLPSFAAHTLVPQLHYRLSLRRKFLGPFISTVMRVIVVAFILFIVALICTRDKDRTDAMGFSVARVLGIIGALFFGLLLGHIDLRQSLPSEGITYLESSYLVMYAALMFVALNSVLFVSGAPVRPLQFKDNLIVKLGYWPVLLLVLLAITVFVFYPEEEPIAPTRSTASSAPPLPTSMPRLQPPIEPMPNTPRPALDRPDLDAFNVGMSTALSGPARDLGRGVMEGVQALFGRINRQGGIFGRPLHLVALDDGYEPSSAEANMQHLADEDRILAVLGNVGTPTAAVTVPIANREHLLLLGAFTGAGLLRRNPPDRYVINYRASYEDETAAMVQALLTSGIRPDEIALFTQNDAYGDAGFEGCRKALERSGYLQTRAIAHGRYTRNTLDVTEGLISVLESRTPPRAVIMVGTYQPCARFIEIARQALPSAFFLNVSFVGSSALSSALGESGEGVVITQAVPHFESDLPGVALYRSDLAALDSSPAPSFVSLEGWIVGRIFEEGLRRAGPGVTRESLVDAIESLTDLDLGIGVKIGYGPGDHVGSETVWPTRISRGRCIPMLSWNELRQGDLAGDRELSGQ